MDAEILSCVRQWLLDGVYVEKFSVHCKGNYRDMAYDSIKKYGTFICGIYMLRLNQLEYK